MTNGLQDADEFKVVGQVDNADLADDHLHVGEVIPSGEMNARPARHLLRSVFPLHLQLLIPCSFHAFAVLEHLSFGSADACRYLARHLAALMARGGR
jgi:hypothetical protein